MKVEEGTIEEVVTFLSKLPEFKDLRPLHYYQDRLVNQKALILLMKEGSTIAGCKVGYDRYADGSFYSWLGGVHPDFRKQRIASQLAEYQEDWAKREGFKSIRFKTMNRHRNMLLFAIKNGFQIFNVVPKSELDDYRIELIKRLP